MIFKYNSIFFSKFYHIKWFVYNEYKIQFVLDDWVFFILYGTYATLPQGVEFEKHDVEITDDFRAMYDQAVELWADIDVAITGAKEDGALIGPELKAVRTQQWGAPTVPAPQLRAV